MSVFSFDFLKYYDKNQFYNDLGFHLESLRNLNIVFWVFLNLMLISLYRVLRSANEEIQLKNQEIEKLNQDLQAKVNERTQQLQERNQRLQAYAYTNAHILRAPLSRILGLLNLMYKSEDPEEAKKIKQHLEESARELDNVIRQSSAELERNTDK